MTTSADKFFDDAEQGSDMPPVMISADAYIKHLQRNFAGQLTAVITRNAEQAASIEALQADLTEARGQVEAMKAVMADMVPADLLVALRKEVEQLKEAQLPGL